jgi:hypothetical protein
VCGRGSHVVMMLASLVMLLGITVGLPVRMLFLLARTPQEVLYGREGGVGVM